MIWTKLKKTVESFLADSLRGRIEYHITRYGPGVSHFMTRGWITLDKKELVNFSTIKRFVEGHQMTGLWFSWDSETDDLLDRQGFFTRVDYVDALEEFVGLQIDDALRSTNPIIKAISMLDRRLGKRRLASLSFLDDEHPLISRFYQIRYEAERSQTKPEIP